MNQALVNFFNGMTEKSKDRFMYFAKGFSLFAVEPESYGIGEDVSIIFINNESDVVYNGEDEEGIYIINKAVKGEYKLINTFTNNPLERGVYKMSELPSFSPEKYREDLVASKTLKFSDLDNLPTISVSSQLFDFFTAVSEHISFSEINKLAYQDDNAFKIETIFKIQGSHDGNGSSSVRRILFNNKVVMYANYQGKYGDEATGSIVDKSLYQEMLNYIESKYNGEEMEIETEEGFIFEKFSSEFYDFAEKELQSK
jgi:hypothetical protein